MSETPHQRLVTVAQGEVGVREATGHNDGHKVEAYLATVGLKRGNPWCAAFISWCMTRVDETHAGQRIAARSGGCAKMWQSARKNGCRIVVPGGDLSEIGHGWVWIRAKDAAGAKMVRGGGIAQGHCGIVTGVDVAAGEFFTVEGNTNGAGSREGDGVYSKTQQLGDLRTVGWFDPFVRG